MDNCRWILEAGDVKEEFSDRQLDSFLEGQLNSSDFHGFHGEDITFFSADLQEKAKQAIKEIRVDYDRSAVRVFRTVVDPEEEEEYLMIPDSIGVTRSITEYGKEGSLEEGIAPEFIEEDFIAMRLKEYTKIGKEFYDASGTMYRKILTEKEAMDLIKAEIASWPILTKTGTAIHKVIENTFNGVPTTSSSLSDAHVRNIQNWTNALKDWIYETYGKTAQIYTEFAFKVDDIRQPLKDILARNGIDSIVGKIDLLVIDEFGKAHIFDFKVSRKSLGNWNQKKNSLIPKRKFVDTRTDAEKTAGKLIEGVSEGDFSSSKKFIATNQLAYYAAMLRQKGIIVESAGIIPIKANFAYESEYDIKGLSSIGFPEIGSSEMTFHVPGAVSGDEYNNIADNIINVPNHTFSPEMEEVFDEYKQVFPTVEISTTVSRKELKVENYLNDRFVITLSPSDPDYSEEHKYKFFKKGTRDKKPVYAKDIEDLKSKLADYVEQRNSIRANEVLDFGTVLRDIMLSAEKDIDELDSITIPESQRALLKNQFKKYILDDWELESDDMQISAGFFIFSKGAEVEIVTLTNARLFDVHNLGFGTTVLGKTKRNKNVGSKEILDANNGNLELIKTMIFIANNQAWFKNRKITQIRAFNPWDGQVLQTVLNEQLLQNYKALQINNPGVLPDIDPTIFSRDIMSLIKIASSKMQMIDSAIIDFDGRKYDASQVEDLKKWIEEQMSKFKDKYKDTLSNENTYSADNEIWQVWDVLNQILMRLNGISTKSEIDVEPWLERKISPTGVNFASPQQSSSSNLLDFAKINDRYVAEVRQMVQKRGWEMQRAFAELYKEKGNGTQAFESWFVRDADGKISESFRLKDPNSPEMRGASAVERHALDTFLKTMWGLTHPNASESDLLIAKENGTYYEVPLTEAVFSRQAKNLGVRAAIRNKWKQYRELTEGIFAGDSDAKEKFEADNDAIYNKFALRLDERRQKIKDHTIGFFETHLEIVFNQALVAYTRTEVSKKYVPIFKAMQLGLRHEDEYAHGGTASKQKLKEIRTALDKLIASRVYGKSIIESPMLQELHRWLSVASAFFSTIRLGLNIRSFLREILNGMYIGTTRIINNQLPGVTKENYTEAITYILQDLPHNFSGISLVQQLNAVYGMANYSLGNIANQRKLNWLNIKNWDRSTLFVSCSSPDYQHRMGILIAKMMGDGCWEAHYLNEQGELVYDFRKDKRFEAYIKGDTSDPRYLEQKTLYLKNIEEWNAQGYTKEDGSFLKEGDDLPYAYTNREGQSVKNYADLLYGHYDDESRGLINDMFLGSFFMQYKTFMTAKMEQWAMKEGVYNIESLKQQYDPVTNEKLYEIIIYAEDGMPSREIIKESDLKKRSREEQERARPYIEWTGQPMEGMAWSMWNFVKKIKDFNTPEGQAELRRIWDDPDERGRLIIGCSDMFICALFGLLIKALYGAAVGSEEWGDINKDVRNSGYLTSLSYSVFTGFAKDGPPSAVVKSMLGDMNPPLATNLSQFVTSCANVVTGKQSFTYALTRNVGLLSDFSGIVKQIESEK